MEKAIGILETIKPSITERLKIVKGLKIKRNFPITHIMIISI